MNACAKDIATLLHNQGLGVLGTDLFYSRMPVSPQDCVIVYDNSGAPPMLQLVKERSTYSYHSIHIRSRATKYDTAHEKLMAISTYLHGLHHVVLGDTYYALVRAVTAPVHLHYDENDRPVLLVNYEVQRKPNI